MSLLVKCQSHSCINHMITAIPVSDQFYPLFIHVGARSRSLSLFSVGHNSLMNSPYLIMSNTEQWAALNTSDFSTGQSTGHQDTEKHTALKVSPSSNLLTKYSIRSRVIFVVW